MEALETKEPLDILAYQYDIVGNGIELASGAVRNHSPEIMVMRLCIHWKSLNFPYCIFTS